MFEEFVFTIPQIHTFFQTTREESAQKSVADSLRRPQLVSKAERNFLVIWW